MINHKYIILKALFVWDKINFISNNLKLRLNIKEIFFYLKKI